MRVINFFGAPGAGKSTAALGLCHRLKRAWIECEYVSEFAKGQVWSDTAHLLSRQNWVFANQEFPLSCLEGKVEFAVSDAPLLQAAFYAPEGYPASFTELVFDVFRGYDNVNYFINRAHPYSGTGRLQNETESDKIAIDLKSFLREHGIEFTEVHAGDSTPALIFEQLREQGMIPAHARVD